MRERMRTQQLCFFFSLGSRQEVTVGQILLSPADFKYRMLKMK